MVAHMNGLHLSDNFQPHNINIEDESDNDQAAASSSSYNVNLSPQELEQRLKNAQRITVCDQVRKSLREESEIIPKLLLNRIERPCTALILWRPPEPLENLMTGFESKVSDSDEEGIEMDNNNNGNSMDMDL
jgi:stress-induced morphogen